MTQTPNTTIEQFKRVTNRTQLDEFITTTFTQEKFEAGEQHELANDLIARLLMELIGNTTTTLDEYAPTLEEDLAAVEGYQFSSSDLIQEITANYPRFAQSTELLTEVIATLFSNKMIEATADQQYRTTQVFSRVREAMVGQYR